MRLAAILGLVSFASPALAQGVVPTLNVATPTPAAPYASQVKIATTGTPVCFPANALKNGLAVVASPANTPQRPPSYSGTVGGAGVTTAMDGTGNGFPLAPGGGASFAVPDASAVCVNGTAGDAFFAEGN